MDEREELTLKLWIQVVRLANKLQKDVDSRLRQEFGQNLTRFDVLSQLERVPKTELPVGQLSASLLTSTSNITRLLDRMEADGLLVRRLSKTDRRSFVVSATPKGLSLFRNMALANARWIKDAFVAIDSNKMVALEKALRVIAAD